MIIVGVQKYLVAEVHLKDGTQIDSGAMYAVIWRESDLKFWTGSAWEAAPGSWPTGTYKKVAGWIYLFPTGASAGMDGTWVHYTYTNHMTPGSATSVCTGGEHRVYAEDPLTTSDLSNLDVAVSTRATPAQVNAECDQALVDYNPPTKAELDSAEAAIIAEIDANETKIDLLTPPAGLYEVTIHTKDGGGAPVPFVNVAIYDQTNTTQIWSERTDSNGDWKPSLNAGTYKVRKSKNWFSFAAAETMVVTKDETFTFVGTAFTAPTPSHPNNCVIYGYAWSSGGEAATNARVNMYAVIPQAVSDVQLTDYATHTTTDDDGYFEIEQIKNSEVWVEIAGAGPKVKKTVPDTDNQLFATW